MAQPSAENHGETVVFNVGGKTFEVLREPTLARYPSSLLSQLAEDAEGKEAIFVEADPELFRYLLAFHRHGEIHIPFGVSKEEILREARTLNLPVELKDVVQEAEHLQSLNEATFNVRAVVDSKRKLALEEIVKSRKALEINLVRDLVLECLVEKITGERREVSCSSGEAIGRAGYNSDLLDTRVNGETLEQLLQPWASEHGFQVKVQSQAQLTSPKTWRITLC